MTTNNPRPNSHFASELNMEGMNQVRMLIANPRLSMKDIELSADSQHLFPVTKRQAEYFLEHECALVHINAEDVKMIEELLNKHGMKGRYQYTKSHRSVQFLSYVFLWKALRAEYGIPEPAEEEE